VHAFLQFRLRFSYLCQKSSPMINVLFFSSIFGMILIFFFFVYGLGNDLFNDGVGLILSPFLNLISIYVVLFSAASLSKQIGQMNIIYKQYLISNPIENINSSGYMSFFFQEMIFMLIFKVQTSILHL